MEALGRTKIQIAIVCTGGGSGAIARCFRRAGASRHFVDAAIPYSRAAAFEYLGTKPAGPAASSTFASQLASVALQRAVRFSDRDQVDAVGLALVAALPTEPIRDDQQQIHVAVHSKQDHRCWSRTWKQGEHTRASAESVADEMIYRALAELVNDIGGTDIGGTDQPLER